MENQNAIDELNKLLQINNDRIVGYESAAKEVEESNLKDMFNRFIQTSRRCRAELVSEVRQLGGSPNDNTMNSGKFFRVWMDVKAALTSQERQVLLESCEYGEHHALRTYDSVLNDRAGKLNTSLLSIVKSQYDELKAGHETVRAMRNAAH